jgi:predicted ferric reductase
MDNFWKNIIRYPTFFISSLIGLILVILMPINNLFKIRKLRIIIIITISLVLLTLYFTLSDMVGL